MAPPDQSPPDPLLGRLITTRRRRAVYIVLAILMAPIGVAFTLGGANVLIGAQRGWDFGLLLLAVGLIFLGVTVEAVRQARTRLWFYELGAARTRGRARVTIPYADAAAFTMSLQHQSFNGLYAGTVVRLKLRGPDKRSISYSGSYKVRARGFLKRRYELLDDLEHVRDTIAEQMADTLIERLLHAQPVQWGLLTTLTPDGLLLMRGRRKGQVVPFSQIGRQTMHSGILTLHTLDDQKLVFFSTSGVNFWPCYALFLRLAGQPATAEPLPGTPSENGDDVEDED